MAALIIIAGTQQGEVFELLCSKETVTLGRGNADVCLDDAGASRLHAELQFTSNRWTIKDAGSANGTFVNELKIPRQVILNNNDQIRCGTTFFRFDAKYQADRSTERVERTVDPEETVVGFKLPPAAVNLSHGIKNILQAVSGGIDVVDTAFKRDDTERAQRGWKILKENLQKINKLVLDMLEFSKVGEPVFIKASLNEIVRSAVDTLVQYAAPRNITIDLKTDDRIPPMYLDTDKIHDVILNLVLNALDAVEDNTGVITVSTTLEQNSTTITVADNGAGIKDTKAIFIPFYTSKAKAGTGLGLPIAKKNIEQHNGSIEVNSVPGRGATFIVSLPRQKS